MINFNGGRIVNYIQQYLWGVISYLRLKIQLFSSRAPPPWIQINIQKASYPHTLFKLIIFPLRELYFFISNITLRIAYSRSSALLFAVNKFFGPLYVFDNNILQAVLTVQCRGSRHFMITVILTNFWLLTIISWCGYTTLTCCVTLMIENVWYVSQHILTYHFSLSGVSSVPLRGSFLWTEHIWVIFTRVLYNVLFHVMSYLWLHRKHNCVLQKQKYTWNTHPRQLYWVQLLYSI